MLRFSTSGAIALVLLIILPAAAMAGMGTTTDSSENQRPPELPNRSVVQSDYDIGVRLVRHKQYAEAIPHLQFALADKPKDTEILNYLGYAKSMVGDYDSALYYYQRALAIDPNDKVVHQNLGELYLVRNDLGSAQKELATLTTLCPSGCDERDALAKAVAAYKPASLTPAATTAPAGTASAAGGP